MLGLPVFEERRLQIRYIPRQPIPVALKFHGVEIVGQLADVSSTGCLVVLPTEHAGRIADGAPLTATLTLDGAEDNEITLDGHVTHISAVRCERGAGVRFEQAQRAAIEQLVRGGEAGAVTIRRSEKGAILGVVGQLGFHMNRSFLHPIRTGTITAIDLGRCDGIDSAGLGLLRIAADHQVKVFGARGRVRDLLQIAQIGESRP